MPTTLYEWKCTECGKVRYHRQKPPKKGAFIYRAVFCKTCRRIMKGTGYTKKHYTLQELL